MSIAIRLGFGVKAISFFDKLKVGFDNLRSKSLRDENEVSKVARREKPLKGHLSPRERYTFSSYGLKAPSEISRKLRYLNDRDLL